MCFCECILICFNSVDYKFSCGRWRKLCRICFCCGFSCYLVNAIASCCYQIIIICFVLYNESYFCRITFIVREFLCQIISVRIYMFDNDALNPRSNPYLCLFSSMSEIHRLDFPCLLKQRYHLCSLSLCNIP